MVTTSHDPTNCGAEVAAAQPSQIIGVSTDSVKCSNPKCKRPARPGFMRCEHCATRWREYKRRQRAAAPPPPPKPRHWRECAYLLCRTVFEVIPCNRLYCTDDCQRRETNRRINARNERARRRRGPRFIKCAWCGTRARALTSRKEYCGQGCITQAYLARKAAAA